MASWSTSETSDEELKAYDLSIQTIYKTRGYALIFINDEFPNQEKMNFQKSEEDTSLAAVFQTINFRVRVFPNSTALEMKQRIFEYASRKASCFVCFISTHGCNGSVLGSDSKLIPLKELYKSADTPSLNGKPKCFFVSACRSGRDTDNYKIDWQPEDSVVGYACTVGKNSYVRKGSLYFSYLLKHMNEGLQLPAEGRGKARTITYWLTKVNRDMPRDEQGKQLIFESTLKANLFFHRGYLLFVIK